MDDDFQQQVLLDHYRHPRGVGQFDGADVEKKGINPACNDQVAVFLKLKDQCIDRVGFEGQGCVISQASASLMVDYLKGKSVDDATAMAQALRDVMLKRGQSAEDWPELLEDFEVLSGVRKQASRIKCALLAWNVFLDGLGVEKNKTI